MSSLYGQKEGFDKYIILYTNHINDLCEEPILYMHRALGSTLHQYFIYHDRCNFIINDTLIRVCSVGKTRLFPSC